MAAEQEKVILRPKVDKLSKMVRLDRLTCFHVGPRPPVFSQAAYLAYLEKPSDFGVVTHGVVTQSKGLRFNDHTLWQSNSRMGVKRSLRSG